VSRQRLKAICFAVVLVLLSLVLPASVAVADSASVVHFTGIGPTQSNISVDFYGYITIAGVDAQIGDEVGVFDAGGQLCGAWGMDYVGAYGAVHVFGDDPSTPEDEGASPGDSLTFRVWDASVSAEYEAVTNVVPVTWTIDGDQTWVNLVAVTEVISCDASGDEKNAFAPGEIVYVKGYGFAPGTYNLWIQADGLVPEGGNDISGSDPSAIQETVQIGPDGILPVTAIWDILSSASPTAEDWDIIVDDGDGVYNAAADGIDKATSVGFVAPVPELPALALFGIGLVGLVGYLGIGHRKHRQRHDVR